MNNIINIVILVIFIWMTPLPVFAVGFLKPKIQLPKVSEPLPVFAVGFLKPGDRCTRTEECGLNMGCRKSEIGDYKVCKISVPNTPGCAIPYEENLCTDGMVCKNNYCRLTYGVRALEGEGESLGGQLSSFFSFFDLRKLQNLPLIRKIFNVILAAALLIGITLFIKGWLLYKNAYGYKVQEERGFKFLGIGGILVFASIILWVLFGR